MELIAIHTSYIDVAYMRQPCANGDVVSAFRESYSIGGSRGLCTFVRHSVAKCGGIAVRQEASDLTTSRIAYPF